MSLALLTPVPLVHLEDGIDVCQSRGKVAFGSQAWEVFRELDQSGAANIPVLIYASHADGPPSMVVSWTASYLRYVESRGGAHPDRTRYRPRSTVEHGEDADGYWAGFYEVADLRRLPDGEQISIASLRDRSGSAYRRAFIPERPMIVTARDVL